jgi:DNA modification methylase
MIEINKIYNEDFRVTTKRMSDNFVDSIVTDPPYELGFMSKKWDNSGIAYNVEGWKECLRVLKPGGYLLAFGGTRTQHRMVCAIEDAGFEIRDTILWLYGCLSDDTEILTKKGWIQYRKSKEFTNFVDEEILIYDIQNDIYKWEKPQRWNEYSAHKDTAYRIQSDNTNQIVSRNHRCLVEREGNLVFIQAERLSNMENMPTLPDNIFELQKRQSNLLQSAMQRILQRTGMGNLRITRKGRLDRRKLQELCPKNEWSKQSCMERGSNLLQKTWQLCTDKICQVSERIFAYGSQRRLCYGTSLNSSTGIRQMSFENRNSASYRSQPDKQRLIEPNVLSHQSGTQNLRRSKSYDTTKATITPIEYSGIIFCPTVSTGAFIARRNGKIFITGNSGFPKSLDIGKAISKLTGEEREIVGDYKWPDGGKRDCENHSQTKGEIQYSHNKGMKREVTKDTSEWEGYGTALKPACEMITMARKPLSEKTVAQNVLKWGTGGINIDGCRIEFNNNEPDKRVGTNKIAKGASKNPFQTGISDYENPMYKQGRFPANVILSDDEEVLSQFPNSTPSKMDSISKGKNYGIYGKYNGKHVTAEASEGSAARFFYIAKADQVERQDGCHEMQKKPPGMVSNTSGQHITRRDGNAPQPKGNNHPTVKPLKLIQYLQRLVTPKGGITYDPFGGSGTSAMAASNEGFKWIMSELVKEHYDIAVRRIYNNNGLFL